MSTTTTEVTHVINSEFIQETIDKARLTPYIYQSLVKVTDITGKGTRQSSHPLLNNLSAASSHTQNNEVSASAMGFTDNTISTSLYAVRVELSEAAERSSVQDLRQAAVLNCLDALEQRVDTSTLALATSMADLGGGNSQACTVSFINQVMAAFRARVRYAQNVAVVLHTDSVTDLMADLESSTAAAFGGIFGQQSIAALQANGAWQMGARGMLPDGALVFVSDRLPASDTTGHANMIVTIGPDAGIGLTLNQGLRVREEPRVRYLQTNFIGDIDFGVGILDANRCGLFTTRDL